MKLKEIAKWNTRVSLVYAIGVWTIFGTFGYYHLRVWPRQKEEQRTVTGISADEEELKDLVEESAATEETKKYKNQLNTTVVYRENFVPYSTRIINFIKSIGGGGDNDSQRQASEK